MKIQQPQQRHEDNEKGVITIRGNNIEPVPLDMTIEILKRLPAKSLMRFICISKQWCSIIRSRSFTDSFMSMSLSRPRLLFCYDIYNHPIRNENRLLFLSLPLLRQESKKSSSMVFKHDFPFPDSSNYTSIVFCNLVRGIICMYVSGGYLLCNPTTRQVLKIPNDLSCSNPDYSKCFMCLAYDTSKDQFKILSGMVSLSGTSHHSVCSLELGQEPSFSSWRRVESSILYDGVCTNVLCIDGSVYYGACNTQIGNSFVIVSFDVGSERLLLIETPQKDDYVHYLINYKGKLACVCFLSGYSYWNYLLHVLDDAKKQIWSTTFGIYTLITDTYINLGVRICSASTKDGEIILVPGGSSRNAFELLYHDIDKNMVRRRGLIGEIIVDDKLIMCPSDIVQGLSISCDHVENIISFSRSDDY